MLVSWLSRLWLRERPRSVQLVTCTSRRGRTLVQVMQRELGTVVEYVSRGYSVKISIDLRQISLVTPMFKDSHPRVKFAACQCM